MGWTKQQINLHRRAALLLVDIKDEVFDLIYNGQLKTEFEAREFIYKNFKKYGLTTGSFPPHVAFGVNTCFDEYFPSQYSRRFKEGSLVMLDIEAKLNHPLSPFADITWTHYVDGKPLKEMILIFNAVKLAREDALDYLQSCLRRKYVPTGKQVDSILRSTISRLGYGDYFNHHGGHSLGTTRSHGRASNIIRTNNKPLKINMGYTIEPGIYLSGKFGLRSEINFYINTKKELIITTPQQKTLSYNKS